MISRDPSRTTSCTINGAERGGKPYTPTSVHETPQGDSRREKKNIPEREDVNPMLDLLWDSALSQAHTTYE